MILGTAIISGFSIFINKLAISIANPYIFVFIKNFLVAIILSLILLTLSNFKTLKLLKKRQWVILLIIGLIGGGIPFILFFKGLSMTSAAGASFIQKTMFIWIIIFAGTFLREKITRNQIFAGLILIGGNLMLLKLSDIHFDLGSGLVLLATLFWAAENTLSKYTIKELSPMIVMWARMFFGSLFIMVFLAFNHQLVLLADLNIQQIGWASITSVLLFGYVYTWYTGLQYIKVSEAAVVLMLGSPITTMLSAIFTRPAALREYFAMVLIIVGVSVAIGLDKFGRKLKQIYVRN